MFCYLTSTTYDSFDFEVVFWLSYGKMYSFFDNDWFGNLQYLRPVVALDSKTTVNQVSIIGEIENPTWTWYDVCGKQAGS